MADLKISQLTAATTPLASTEVLPIVQSSTTKKATIADVQAATVAAGTANGVQYLNASKIPTTGTALTFSGTNFGVNTSSPQSRIQVNPTGAYGIGTLSNAGLHISPTNVTGGFATGSVIWSNYALGGTSIQAYISAATYGNNYMDFSASGTATQWRLDSNGNFIPQTAAKGVNFTANTPAAGMTSQLLNWYEEGTWTPTFTGWATAPSSVVGARYTRVGRQVTLNLLALDGVITGGTSVISGLPFTSSSVNGSSVLLKDVSGNTVSSFATIANSATQIASMTTATFTGLECAWSVTDTV